jgi:hypothetical protein
MILRLSTADENVEADSFLWPGSSDPGIARSAIALHAALPYPASREARV